ncbi:unnamed protein product [Rotaria sordida]|uniref:Uncharacterized protein n=1 Tax=Rotaria sordida TaxID=392033 RepID=A0A814WBZ9_9BILA|nr:unnamed protein product [Rotaria sordida]
MKFVLPSSSDEYDELTDDEETDDKYEETTDQEEDSDSEADDYNENEHYDIKNHFTLEEMENIIEWVGERPNARFTTISHQFQKIKSMKAIEKETVHDDDLQLYAIQKARELDWDTFKANKSFINTFKKENDISSRRTIQTEQNKFRKVFPHQDSQLLIFPEGSTGDI